MSRVSWAHGTRASVTLTLQAYVLLWRKILAPAPIIHIGSKWKIRDGKTARLWYD